MEIAKKGLLKLIRDIPENQIIEIIDFIEYLKLKMICIKILKNQAVVLIFGIMILMMRFGMMYKQGVKLL